MKIIILINFFNNLFNSQKKENKNQENVINKNERKSNLSNLLGHKIAYKNTNIDSYFKAQNKEKEKNSLKRIIKLFKKSEKKQ